MDYYDGTKLLSLSDLDGQKPEVIICTSNRSAGKTTYFNRLVVNRFKKRGEKFTLLYRYKYEIQDCADKFFKDIKGLFFPNDVMTAQPRMNGIFYELFLNDEACGYAISLNSADQLKKVSHMLSDTGSILFDEFQSENNQYCANEVQKFISIHTTIARGQGQQSRYVPVYMISNPVTILNPYYVELGIADRLDNKTRFLRGHGWILEQGYNDAASQAQSMSAFNKAFAKNSYSAYAQQGVYLNDNEAFIEKLNGTNRYVMTLRYLGKDYAIRSYSENGIMYCDNIADGSFPIKICVTTEDHNINYIMLKQHELALQKLRYIFNRGGFRFKNLQCKQAVLAALGYVN